MGREPKRTEKRMSVAKPVKEDPGRLRPTRRRLASKKFACSVSNCPISAQSHVEKTDQYGPSGYRCSGHNGGTRCSVAGCPNSAFRRVKEPDTYGDVGLRCVRHGGRNGMCNVVNCGNVAKYHSVADSFGESGKRCKRHCVKALCEEPTCTHLGRDSEPGKPRRCVYHGGGYRCLQPGCNSSALPKRGPNVPQKCSKHGGGVYCVVAPCKNLALMDFDGDTNLNAKCRKHALQARNGGVPVARVDSRKKHEKKTTTTGPKVRRSRTGAAKVRDDKVKKQKENVKKAKVNLTVEFPSKAMDANMLVPSVLTENRAQSTVTIETYSF